MNIDWENLEKLQRLLAELSELESALKILNNYDSKVYATFWSGYNDNLKEPKKISVSVSDKVKNSIIEDINNRLLQIKKELEKM